MVTALRPLGSPSTNRGSKNLTMFVTQILVADDFLPWQRLVSMMFESESNLKIITQRE